MGHSNPLMKLIKIIYTIIWITNYGVQAQIPSMDVLGQYMRIAARAGDAAYIQGLISFGVPVDLQDPNGFTPLLWGAYFNRSEVVNLLLENGANVNHVNLNGDSALMWTALGDFYDIAVVLLQYGANPDLQERDGFTALMGAAVRGHYEIVELLTGAGADKNIENDLGQAAITLASFMDHDDVVEHLADAENVDHVDLLNLTPMHHAVIHNLTAAMEKLLVFCPNHTIRDHENKTALDRAYENGWTEGIKKIEEQLTASCTRYGVRYEVGDQIYQGCKQLVCYCTKGGRWKSTGVKHEKCYSEKNMILLKQTHRGGCAGNCTTAEQF